MGLTKSVLWNQIRNLFNKNNKDTVKIYNHGKKIAVGRSVERTELLFQQCNNLLSIFTGSLFGHYPFIDTSKKLECIKENLAVSFECGALNPRRQAIYGLLM